MRRLAEPRPVVKGVLALSARSARDFSFAFRLAKVTVTVTTFPRYDDVVSSLPEAAGPSAVDQIEASTDRLLAASSAITAWQCGVSRGGPRAAPRCGGRQAQARP